MLGTVSDIDRVRRAEEARHDRVLRYLNEAREAAIDDFKERCRLLEDERAAAVASEMMTKGQRRDDWLTRAEIAASPSPKHRAGTRTKESVRKACEARARTHPVEERWRGIERLYPYGWLVEHALISPGSPG